MSTAWRWRSPCSVSTSARVMHTPMAATGRPDASNTGAPMLYTPARTVSSSML